MALRRQKITSGTSRSSPLTTMEFAGFVDSSAIFCMYSIQLVQFRMLRLTTSSCSSPCAAESPSIRRPKRDHVLLPNSFHQDRFHKPPHIHQAVVSLAVERLWRSIPPQVYLKKKCNSFQWMISDVLNARPVVVWEEVVPEIAMLQGMQLGVRCQNPFSQHL